MSSIVIHWPTAGQGGSRPREIAVLGAAGRTGQLVVQRALAHDYLVTAFVHRPDTLALAHDRLQIITGDIFDADVVGGVVQGRDAVIALVAPESEKQANFFYYSTTTILRAMANNGIQRFLCVSACAARETAAPLPPGITGKLRQPFQRHRALHEDMRLMEDLVGNSPTNFLVARVIALTDHPPTNTYQTTLDAPKGAKPLSRANLADFLVDACFAEAYRRASVVVTPGAKEK